MVYPSLTKINSSFVQIYNLYQWYNRVKITRKLFIYAKNHLPRFYDNSGGSFRLWRPHMEAIFESNKFLDIVESVEIRPANVIEISPIPGEELEFEKYLTPNTIPEAALW